MSSGYKINEKDIDTVLSILKRTDPENATSENAIDILESFQSGIHTLAHTNPELLKELQKELKKD